MRSCRPSLPRFLCPALVLENDQSSPKTTSSGNLPGRAVQGHLNDTGRRIEEAAASFTLGNAADVGHGDRQDTIDAGRKARENGCKEIPRQAPRRAAFRHSRRRLSHGLNCVGHYSVPPRRVGRGCTRPVLSPKATPRGSCEPSRQSLRRHYVETGHAAESDHPIIQARSMLRVGQPVAILNRLWSGQRCQARNSSTTILQQAT